MNTQPIFTPSRISAVFAASLMFASGQAAAADDESQAIIFWLAGFPEWVFPVVLAAVFAGLALLVLAAARRWLKPREGAPNRRAGYYAAASGAILGALVALLSADTWEAYLFETISALPSPAAGGPPALLGSVRASVPQHFTRSPKVKANRSRTVQPRLNALDQDSITLNLFADTTFVAVKDRVVKTENGRSVWVGHIEDELDSEVILAVSGRAMMGTVKRGDEAWDIVYAGNDTHVVRQVDPHAESAHSHPIEVTEAEMEADAASSTTESGNTTLSANAATGAVIDLMVVYSPQARINAGGVPGIEAKILNAVASANQSYLNSQINMQVNLVHMEEVSYTETGDMTAAVMALKSTTDGKMDNVHSLRTQYGADQVALIVADKNVCGVGYQMLSLSSSFASSAFVAVHDDAVYNCLGGITLQHELGHNQGNSHDPANSGAAGIYPYSYGYRICGVFRDVMSYNCSGEPQIRYFSNPNVIYNGNPTGVVNFNDTALSMNNAASTVANFKGTAATVAPNAPGNLAATVQSSSSIALTWADNAGDETGYYVQRSVDGVNWSLIATLGSNVTSFTNTGLAASTAYSYRVYAYNSIGNSAFSNTATATTSPAVAATPDTTAPVVTISNPAGGAKVSGTVQVSVKATDNISVSSLKLYIDGKLLSSTNSGVLSYNWNTRKASAGSHTINAQSTDPSGNAGSQSVTVSK